MTTIRVVTFCVAVSACTPTVDDRRAGVEEASTGHGQGARRQLHMYVRKKTVKRFERRLIYVMTSKNACVQQQDSSGQLGKGGEGKEKIRQRVYLYSSINRHRCVVCVCVLRMCACWGRLILHGDTNNIARASYGQGNVCAKIQGDDIDCTIIGMNKKEQWRGGVGWCGVKAVVNVNRQGNGCEAGRGGVDGGVGVEPLIIIARDEKSAVGLFFV